MERNGYPRGDLLHVLLQPGPRRIRRRRRHVLRRAPRHGAGHRRAAAADAARCSPRRTRRRADGRARLPAIDGRPGRQRRRRPVRADLPARTGRRHRALVGVDRRRAPAIAGRAESRAPRSTAHRGRCRRVAAPADGELVAGAVRADWRSSAGPGRSRRLRRWSLPLADGGLDRASAHWSSGVSPRRPFDDEYRGFLELVAGQIGERDRATRAPTRRSGGGPRRWPSSTARRRRSSRNVSHEFRTPLTLMLGPARRRAGRTPTALPPGPRAPRGRAPQRAAAAEAGQHAARLLAHRGGPRRRRATSRPTSRALTRRPGQRVPVGDRERPGCALVVDCPPLPSRSTSTATMWEKIVLNLLSNAFKFTFEGEIAVTPARDAATARCCACATPASASPADELPHLFERFHRVEGARGRTHEGTGIGLALVQELVRLHGGDGRGRERARGRARRSRVAIPLGTRPPAAGPDRRRTAPTPSTAASARHVARGRAGWPRRAMGGRPPTAAPMRPDRDAPARGRASLARRRQRRHARLRGAAARATQLDVEAVGDGAGRARPRSGASRPTWCSPTS